MLLINVRKGQFVYYENKLHKVYSVKPFFKQSVHLIRLSDYEQVLTTAKEIDLYKPKHMDSFICNGHRYTLDRDKKATIGDYILVIDPRPDSLDHHHLHAIEIVSSIEDHGVISNKANGIKHNEYWVMVPGLLEGANIIDWQYPEKEETTEGKKEDVEEMIQPEVPDPKVGDVFQKNDSDPILHVMIVAIEGQKVYLGNGMTVSKAELKHSDKWSYVLNTLE